MHSPLTILLFFILVIPLLSSKQPLAKARFSCFGKKWCCFGKQWCDETEKPPDRISLGDRPPRIVILHNPGKDTKHPSTRKNPYCVHSDKDAFKIISCLTLLDRLPEDRKKVLFRAKCQLYGYGPPYLTWTERYGTCKLDLSLTDWMRNGERASWSEIKYAGRKLVELCKDYQDSGEWMMSAGEVRVGENKGLKLRLSRYRSFLHDQALDCDKSQTDNDPEPEPEMRNPRPVIPPRMYRVGYEPTIEKVDEE